MPFLGANKRDILTAISYFVIGSLIAFTLVYYQAVLHQLDGSDFIGGLDAVFFIFMIGGAALAIYGLAKLVNTLILKW